jgi:succinyl-diaminopimelate desuccinylase
MAKETRVVASTGDPPPATVAALRGALTLREPFLVDVLSSLVKTRSVNPGTSEKAVADVVEGWLAEKSISSTQVEFAPGRPSVGAVIEGAHEGPTVVLNGHMDTVPIDNESLWTTDPFGAEVRDGFLFGRGACDMKAGLAVQIGVAHYLSDIHPDDLKGSLVLHFAAGEERGEPGTRSLLEAGFSGDYGITTEPTSLRVATATRGVATYGLRIKGRSVHGSRPEAGVNPIWALAPVLEMLKQYDADLRSRPHPLLPGGSCTPTRVRAGVKENAVPDDCEIVVDRRLLPGETAEGTKADLLERMQGLEGFNPELDYELGTDYIVEPAEIAPDSPFAAQMLAAVREVTGEPSEVWGAPFSSDVRNLVNDAAMIAVTFGPGDTRFCHCPDERVPIAELEQAAVSIAKVVTDLLVEGRRNG